MNDLLVFVDTISVAQILSLYILYIKHAPIFCISLKGLTKSPYLCYMLFGFYPICN